MLLRLVRDGLGFHRRSASYAGHGPTTDCDNIYVAEKDQAQEEEGEACGSVVLQDG